MQSSIDTISRGRTGRVATTLRDGTWLTPGRLRAYPRIVGATLALALIGLVATSHHGIDPWGRPLGSDFSGVWVAGQAVRAGHPALPYDNAANAAAQAAAFGPSDSFLPWPYPPLFLVVAGLLATLPYLAALALWQGATLSLYLAAVLRCVGDAIPARRDTIVAALAYPAVTIGLLHGQNGFLSAALIGFGTLSLPRRPVMGGVLLGLLAYKPQLALAVPVALAAGRHWRALAAAGATVALAAAGTLVAFGPEPWLAFVRNLGFARKIILEAGGLESFKMQSAFAAARLVGAPLALAYGAQGIATGLALAGLAWLWHRGADPRLQLAGLALASLLATPYAVDYDMVVVGLALAALTAAFRRDGFPPFAKSLMGAAWVVPLAARTIAGTIHLPVGFLATAALMGLVLAAARSGCAGRPARSIGYHAKSSDSAFPSATVSFLPRFCR